MGRKLRIRLAAIVRPSPPHNSLSEFTQNGTPNFARLEPLHTPAGGWTQGPLSWPQGTVSDQRGQHLDREHLQ